MDKNVDPDTSKPYGEGKCQDVSATPQDIEAHRNTVGEILQTLSDHGFDVTEVAEQAGIPSADVQELSHDDLKTAVAYVAQNHPEVLQAVAQKVPGVQNLIAIVSTGPLAGLCGQIFGEQSPPGRE